MSDPLHHLNDEEDRANMQQVSTNTMVGAHDRTKLHQEIHNEDLGTTYGDGGSTVTADTARPERCVWRVGACSRSVRRRATCTSFRSIIRGQLDRATAILQDHAHREENAASNREETGTHGLKLLRLRMIPIWARAPLRLL